MYLKNNFQTYFRSLPANIIFTPSAHSTYLGSIHSLIYISFTFTIHLLIFVYLGAVVSWKQAFSTSAVSGLRNCNHKQIRLIFILCWSFHPIGILFPGRKKVLTHNTSLISQPYWVFNVLPRARHCISVCFRLKNPD